MPVILIVAVLAVLLLSRRADASTAGGYGGANQAPPPQLGPSTGSPKQWNPPTDIVITSLNPLRAGQNQYGGNEADPRIAGGCWLVPGQSPANQCCYDLATSKTTCDRPVDCNGGPCHTYNFTTPGTAPAPPPPPPRTDGGAPPPPPTFNGNTFLTGPGKGTAPNWSPVVSPLARTRTGAGAF